MRGCLFSSVTWVITISAPAVVVPAAEVAVGTAPAGPAPATSSAPADVKAAPTVDGFRGRWSTQGPLDNEYRFQNSGGFATWSPLHTPAAIYSEKADKTFFVYAGAALGNDTGGAASGYPILVSYYDHKTYQLARPRIVLNRTSPDPAGNASLTLDNNGHLWIFAAAQGTEAPGEVFKSAAPFSIDAFIRTSRENFSFPQPWAIDGQGIMLVYTRVNDETETPCFKTSADGVAWSEEKPLAALGKRHQVISGRFRNKIGMAITVEDEVHGERGPTQLYYIESNDFGRTWHTMTRQPVELPLKDPDSPARIREYKAWERFVYLKDMHFDRHGNPTVLYLLTLSTKPGPHPISRFWTTARWTGREWEATGILPADNNADNGCLAAEGIVWRMIAPTIPGPQRFNAGGEMVLWTSDDMGRSWRPRPLTLNSRQNHNNARRPIDAKAEFFAFWCSGDAREPSAVRLYFCDKEGRVFQMPEKFSGEFATTQPQ